VDVCLVYQRGFNILPIYIRRMIILNYDIDRYAMMFSKNISSKISIKGWSCKLSALGK